MATVEFSEQRARDLADNIRDTECCGLAEFSGLYVIRNASDAKAIRRAAYLRNTHGLVFVTGTQDQLSGRLYRDLREAGFRKHAKFNNPNTGNSVTLLSATTLRRKGK